MSRTVVITGIARGIGREVAVILARSGDTVIGFDRNDAGIARLKKEMERIGARHFLSHLDITDTKGVAKFGNAIFKEFGAPDVVVSNAAVATFGAFEETDLAAMLESLSINVLGAAAVFQAFIPGMRERGAGRLIAMSSFTGIVPFPFESIDTACNFAVQGLVRALRYEVEPFGIEVGMIEPSIVATDLTKGIYAVPPAGSPYRERIQRFIAKDRELKKGAMGPAQAAEKIVKIITGKKLRLHNRIDATSALFLSIDKFLPAGLRDGILLGQMDIKL